MRAKLLQSCPIMLDPMDCSLPGSSAHGLLQARVLEWVVMPFSRGSSQPRDRTHVSYISCIGRRVLYHEQHLGSPEMKAAAAAAAAKSLQSCLTLCDPMDCSPSGSSVHEILQTGILEWIAMPSFRGTSQPRDRTHVSYVSCTGRQALYHQHQQGSHSELKTETFRGNGSFKGRVKICSRCWSNGTARNCR